ncbi:ATP-binding protein, partial [candidate division KSB1 bacterium]
YNKKTYKQHYSMETGYGSLAAIPLKIEDELVGHLQLMSSAANFFNSCDFELCERIAETVGNAALDRNRQLALKERVKELGCLYGISKIIEEPELSLEKILEKIVEMIPPAWLYPKITAARIVLDNRTYDSRGYKDTSQKLSSKIIVEGIERGIIEVVYLRKMPEIYEGPFLLEERSLLDAIAQQLSYIIKRKSDEEEKSGLLVQIQHADRLATVGQLAAGVAHELNEPLANILGFAQIILDEAGLPEQTIKDMKKIEDASLYAREIVKKLLFFAKQMPQTRSQVDINQVIENALFFFESRCQKEGIKVIKKLDTDLPLIFADSAQIQQVIINLVVNAIQAMPDGGVITLSTLSNGKKVSLVVEDNGPGMDEDVKSQLFVPFFTTKDIDQGTGLGLPVVHGIVSSHSGSIIVDSEKGKGSRFEVVLPAQNVDKNEN